MMNLKKSFTVILSVTLLLLAASCADEVERTSEDRGTRTEVLEPETSVSDADIARVAFDITWDELSIDEQVAVCSTFNSYPELTSRELSKAVDYSISSDEAYTMLNGKCF